MRASYALGGVGTALGIALGIVCVRPSHAIEPQDQHVTQAWAPEVLSLRPIPASLLRADFEAPDTLLVVYDSDWEASLERLTTLARPHARVLVLPSEEELHVSARAFAARTGASYVPLPVDSPWVRDFAPLQRGTEGQRIWIDYVYSDQRPLDDSLPPRLAKLTGMPLEREQAQLDGGAVVSNGAGLCAVTDVSLNDAALDLTDAVDRERLLGRLGCAELAVLPALPDEETGHADMIAQFTARDTVLLADADRARHPAEHAGLREAARRLKRAAARLGIRLRIVRVPMHIEGELHYSYVNGIRLRDAYVVPRYSRVRASLERIALQRLQGAMPGVPIVPLDADSMIRRLGAVHCVTAGLNTDGRLPKTL